MEIKNNTENNITNQLDYSYYSYISVLIFEKIKFYTLILTVVIGIPGNIISILIFIKPCLNTKTNTGLLYHLLCALNLIAILFNVIVTNSNRLFKYDVILPLSIDFFIGNILLQFISWTQVIISFDRFIAVVYSIKGVRIISKRWVLNSIILGTFVVILGVNSTYFIRISTFTVNNKTFKVNYIMSEEIYILNNILRLLMQLFIPYLIMVILDLIAISRLRKRKLRLSVRRRSQVNFTNKSSRFSRNTILIDLIYLIFNFPSTIFDIVYTLYQIFPNMPSFPIIWECFIEIFQFFPYIYASLLFVVFIIFNKIFRAEFIAMLNQQKCVIFLKNLILKL